MTLFTFCFFFSLCFLFTVNTPFLNLIACIHSHDCLYNCVKKKELPQENAKKHGENKTLIIKRKSFMSSSYGCLNGGFKCRICFCYCGVELAVLARRTPLSTLKFASGWFSLGG